MDDAIFAGHRRLFARDASQRQDAASLPPHRPARARAGRPVQRSSPLHHRPGSRRPRSSAASVRSTCRWRRSARVITAPRRRDPQRAHRRASRSPRGHARPDPGSGGLAAEPAAAARWGCAGRHRTATGAGDRGGCGHRDARSGGRRPRGFRAHSVSCTPPSPPPAVDPGGPGRWHLLRRPVRPRARRGHRPTSPAQRGSGRPDGSRRSPCPQSSSPSSAIWAHTTTSTARTERWVPMSPITRSGWTGRFASSTSSADTTRPMRRHGGPRSVGRSSTRGPRDVPEGQLAQCVGAGDEVSVEASALLGVKRGKHLLLDGGQPPPRRR